MSISIHINNSITSGKHSAEVEAALEMKDYLESIADVYINVSGDIYILASQPLSFQKRNDIDLIILGVTNGLRIPGPFKVQTNKNQYRNVNSVILKSFIATIELKSHDASGIRMLGNSYEVKYASQWHDASKQSNEAKFSLVNFIDTQKWLSKKQFICDILWFKSITDEDIQKLRKDPRDNAIAGHFNIFKFTEALLSQAKVIEDCHEYIIDFFNHDGFNEVIEFFTKPRVLGGLTLKKFNLISSNLLKKEYKASSKALTVAEGKAGTGKTLWLLQKAIEFSGNSEVRCLLLTYNNSLVYDLQRIIDGFEEIARCPKILSVHAFLRGVMKETGINVNVLNESGKNFDVIFRDKTNELRRLSNPSLRKYDYVFIDESQDLTSTEKEIFLKIFGFDRIIAADGIDQFVRKTKPVNWRSICKSQIELIEFEVCKRQKSNLVTFVNAFAHEHGLKWKMKADHLLTGGKVKIYDSYNSTIHNDLLKDARNNGCEEYDLLILVPPEMIISDNNTQRNKFSKADAFRSCHINFFDGTDPNSRSAIPSIDSCRIFPYQSCRGLEGWSVVCYWLDAMYETLFSQAAISDSYQGLNPKVDRMRQAIQWLLMPLTRPIDTIVITLRDPSSEFGKMLKKISTNYPDFIEWHCQSQDDNLPS